MKETWKIIENFTNYEISNLGRVRNTKTGKIRKLVKDKDGYFVVGIRLNGKIKMLKLHRLVAQAFIPNPNNYLIVNHKDENKSNNNVENLEWCTIEYNNSYGTRIERSRISQLNNPDKSKLVYQYDLRGNFINEFPSTKEVFRSTGICRPNVVACCNGRLKSAGGFIWRYDKI